MSGKIALAGFLLGYLRALPTGDLSQFLFHPELVVSVTGLAYAGCKGMLGKGWMLRSKRKDGFETEVGKKEDYRSDTKVHGPSRMVRGRELAEPGDRKGDRSACWENIYLFLSF